MKSSKPIWDSNWPCWQETLGPKCWSSFGVSVPDCHTPARLCFWETDYRPGIWVWGSDGQLGDAAIAITGNANDDLEDGPMFLSHRIADWEHLRKRRLALDMQLEILSSRTRLRTNDILHGEQQVHELFRCWMASHCRRWYGLLCWTFKKNIG